MIHTTGNSSHGTNLHLVFKDRKKDNYRGNCLLFILVLKIMYNFGMKVFIVMGFTLRSINLFKIKGLYFLVYVSYELLTFIDSYLL